MQLKDNDIKKQVQSVLQYSQGYSFEPNVDDIIEKWSTNKKSFIDAWDGKLIYEHPEELHFELDEESKIKEVCKLCDKVKSCGFSQLSDFIYSTRNDFFTNVLSEDYNSLSVCISKGIKLTKAYKFFISDENVLREIQDWASLVMQKNKINGHLCISVHPLDFLSSSENTYNWRSCHALDGEYRAGNINYMVDDSTVICYIKSSSLEKIPNFPKDIPWTNKKWRMLLHFSQDKNMLFAGRQYPYSSQQILNFIGKTVIPAAGLGKWTQWLDYKLTKVETDSNYFGTILTEPFIPVGNTLKRLKMLVKNGKNTHHFNDVLYSSVYSPQYCYRDHSNPFWGNIPTGWSSNTTKFVIGESAKCVFCGQEEIGHSDTFLCPSCCSRYDKESRTCSHCGNIVLEEDAYYLANGEVICPDCYNSGLYHRCYYCDEIFPVTETTFDFNNGTYYCSQHSHNIQERSFSF